MTPEAKEALATVATRRDELMAAATTDQIRVKLANLDEVCRVLVVDAGQRLTVPEVVRRYKARFVAREQNLAEQSLRNKRGGSNPYHALYTAWAGAAEFVLAPRRTRRQPPMPGEMLSQDDVAGIDDVPLRHQVGLVLAQNRSLKAELDILKDVRNAPVLRIEGGLDRFGGGQGLAPVMPLANHLALTETEVEALRDFVDRRRLKARGLRGAEDGAVESMDGRRFSDPGFLEAVDKIVRSYDR